MGIAFRIARGFFLSAGLILLFTGTLKLASVLWDASEAQRIDAIFGVQYSSVLFVVGMLETSIGVHCLFSRRTERKLTCVLAFSFACVVYRLGLIWIGEVAPCNCMGAFRAILSWLAKHEANLAGGFLAFLVLGSNGCLLLRLLERKDRERPPLKRPRPLASPASTRTGRLPTDCLGVRDDRPGCQPR